MNRRRNGRTYECVAVDLNTQRDFCEPGGAHPVANLEQFIPKLRRMIAWTKRNYAPIVSSIDSHRPEELAEYGNHACCVDGSAGQRKIAFTLFPQCARVEVDNTLAIPLDLFWRHQQVIFRKRTDDLLGNPKADRFMTQLPTEEFLIFGNTLECSVKALTLALLTRHKKVIVVVDACGYWNKACADLALRQMAAKGGFFTTVDQLRTRKLDRSHRYAVTRARCSLRAARGDRGGNGKKGNGNGRRNAWLSDLGSDTRMHEADEDCT